MTPRRRRAAALLLLVGLTMPGCERHEAAPSPLTLPWQAVRLPADGEIRVAALAACEGRWYAVGSAGAGPAAFTSTDATRWSAVALRPVTPYGSQGGFTSVACRGGDAVAISKASGGVHGHARVSTWRSAGGTWDEVSAPFELYGGARAGSVDRVVPGPDGWLVVGHRVSPTGGLLGAAVWFSPDGFAFRLIDDDPALRSTAGALTAGYDAVRDPAGGWLLLGSSGTALTPKPAAWASSDALAWRRTTVAGTAAGAIERAVPFGGGLLAVGAYGDRFAAWRGTSTGFTPAGDVCAGRPPPAGFGVSALVGVSTAGGGAAMAAIQDQLCLTLDGAGWREVIPPTAGRPGRLHLASNNSLLLLAIEAPSGADLWMANLAAVSPRL